MPTKTFQSVFNNTTNSYKFYWWLAIVHLVKEKQQKELSFSDIFIVIISQIWYPVNYYKLSFGRQDKLSRICNEIKEHYHIKEDINEAELVRYLHTIQEDVFFIKLMKETTRYVPYRFLRPWFANEMQGMPDGQTNNYILNHQTDKALSLPYTLHANKIIVSHSTVEWIMNDYQFITSFTYFHLFQYIEKNNVNTPSLLLKLFKPQSRNLSLATRLWKSYLIKNNNINCIFQSSEIIKPIDFSIDHYLPWSYCTHDQLWNLHPVSKSINSSKSNHLPHPIYLDDYIALQYDFSRYLILDSHARPLEDYHNLFKTNNDIFTSWSKQKFNSKLKETYLPMFEIAENMGFQNDWLLR